MDRDHGRDAEQPAGDRGVARIHGEEVADRQEAELGTVELRDELHVGEERRVAGVVEGVAAGKPDHESSREAAVHEPVRRRDSRRVIRAHHRHPRSQHVEVAAEVHADAVLDALAGEPGRQLVAGDHLRRLVPGRELDRIAHVIGMSVRDQHGVDARQRLRRRGTGRVVVDPGVDQDRLAARQRAEDGRVAKVEELGTRARIHRLLLLS